MNHNVPNKTRTQDMSKNQQTIVSICSTGY